MKLCNRQSYDRSVLFTWRMSWRKQKSSIVIRSQFATNVLNARLKFSQWLRHFTASHNNNFHRSHESIATNGTVWVEREEEEKKRVAAMRRCALAITSYLIADVTSIHVCVHCTSHIVSKPPHSRWRLARTTMTMTTKTKTAE